MASLHVQPPSWCRCSFVRTKERKVQQQRASTLWIFHDDSCSWRKSGNCTGHGQFYSSNVFLCWTDSRIWGLNGVDGESSTVSFYSSFKLTGVGFSISIHTICFIIRQLWFRSFICCSRSTHSTTTFRQTLPCSLRFRFKTKLLQCIQSSTQRWTINTLHTSSLVYSRWLTSAVSIVPSHCKTSLSPNSVNRSSSNDSNVLFLINPMFLTTSSLEEISYRMQNSIWFTLKT